MTHTAELRLRWIFRFPVFRWCTTLQCAIFCWPAISPLKWRKCQSFETLKASVSNRFKNWRRLVQISLLRADNETCFKICWPGPLVPVFNCRVAAGFKNAAVAVNAALSQHPSGQICLYILGGGINMQEHKINLNQCSGKRLWHKQLHLWIGRTKSFLLLCSSLHRFGWLTVNRHCHLTAAQETRYVFCHVRPILNTYIGWYAQQNVLDPFDWKVAVNTEISGSSSFDWHVQLDTEFQHAFCVIHMFFLHIFTGKT